MHQFYCERIRSIKQIRANDSQDQDPTNSSSRPQTQTGRKHASRHATETTLSTQLVHQLLSNAPVRLNHRLITVIIVYPLQSVFSFYFVSTTLR